MHSAPLHCNSMMNSAAPSSRDAVYHSAIALVLMALSASQLLIDFTPWPLAVWGARAAFVGLALVLVPSFALREWALTAMALALIYGLAQNDGGWEQIVGALDRAAFFAAFIYLVTLLKEAAQRSRSVLDLGHYLTSQPPGKRFYALAGGGHTMGVLLNFGAISLLTPLILRGVRASSDDEATIARLDQQQLSALIRGFAWMIMWSPTALTQAVLFTSFPTANLTTVIGLGMAASLTMVLIGRAEDLWRWRGQRRVAVLSVPDFPKRAALRFAAVCALIIGATFATVWAFDVSPAVGLMLVAPSVMIVWVAEQEWAQDRRGVLGRSASCLSAIIKESAPSLGKSAFILGAAGFIGEAAAKLLATTFFAQTMALTGVPDWLFLMVLPVLITLGGQIALSPILVVVFLAAIINQLPVLPADPSLIVYALGAGWAMSMTASPNASATLLISGITGVTPTTLTWRWNGRYALICYALFCVSFIALVQVFPAR